MTEFLQEVGHIVLDPAHLFALVIVDVFVLGMLRPLFARAIRREHLLIDNEHGVKNHGRGTNESR